jgi:histone H3/H4
MADTPDILVVTSKVKKYIKEKGQCNTSAETIDVLSKAVERLCDKGMESARQDGRKTVMARDIVIDHI